MSETQLRSLLAVGRDCDTDAGDDLRFDICPLSQFPSTQSPLLSDHRIVSTYTTMVLNISSVVTLLDKVFPTES